MSDYDLAVEEARRALARQADDVSGIRARAATLVSVGGLTAAFLGGFAGSDDTDARHLSVAAVVGVSSFVLVLASTVAILWPRTFVFAHRGDVLVEWVEEEGAESDEMRRDLALHMQKHYDSNSGRLLWLTGLYCAGLIFLTVEIVSLLIDLRG